MICPATPVTGCKKYPAGTEEMISHLQDEHTHLELARALLALQFASIHVMQGSNEALLTSARRSMELLDSVQAQGRS